MQRMRLMVQFAFVHRTKLLQQIMARCCSLKPRMSDELIPQVVKSQNFQYNEDLVHKIYPAVDSTKKSVHTVHVFDTRIREKKSNGQEIWDSFLRKYKSGEMSTQAVVYLLRGVYSEAHYMKYRETPCAVYTLSVCSVAPLCTLGVLSLIGGGTLHGLLSAQLAYGASVLSFLGGLNSGYAIANNKTDFESLGWSVGPPLVAWVAPLVPLPFGFVFTAVGFAASLIHDVLLTSYPDWLKALRFVMTVITLAALAPSFFASFLSIL